MTPISWGAKKGEKRREVQLVGKGVKKGGGKNTYANLRKKKIGGRCHIEGKGGGPTREGTTGGNRVWRGGGIWDFKAVFFVLLNQNCQENPQKKTGNSERTKTKNLLKNYKGVDYQKTKQKTVIR